MAERIIGATLFILCIAIPAMAQQIDINHAISPFQEQRNAALDTAAFCSLNLTMMAAQAADLQKKLAEAEAKIAELQRPTPDQTK